MPIFRGANPLDSLSFWVKRLIITYFVVWLVQLMFGSILMYYFALTPSFVINKFYVWQLVTYSFLHGGGWHLFFNIFALWMFGSHVENAMGSREFIRFFMFCVLGAAVSQVLISTGGALFSQGMIDADVPVVGASGGIYGILLAFGLLFPDSIIYLFFVLPLRAIQAVMIIALITLVSAVSSGGSRVAHIAHLGGMLTGFILFKFPVWKESFGLWRAARLFKNPKGARQANKARKERENLKAEVDRILDKISSKGVDSLTPEEHKIMKRYAEKKD